MSNPLTPFPVAPSQGVPAQQGLGTAVLVTTGLVTLVSIVGAIWPTIDSISYDQAGVTFDFTQGLGPFGVIAWLVLSRWMANVSRGAAAIGYPQKHSPWVAWWGWVIPIWNLWAPFRFMKDAVQGFAVRHLGWWWATWLVGTIFIWSSHEATTINGVTIESQTLWSAPLNAIALTVSWVLLSRIVWTVSQGSESAA